MGVSLPSYSCAEVIVRRWNVCNGLGLRCIAWLISVKPWAVADQPHKRHMRRFSAWHVLKVLTPSERDSVSVSGPHGWD